ncbi:MAG: hypothetical protein LBJ46_05660 [Planctomycetota bacterium]|jgi:hypothetical protein|nr:hypothetical protein [Planctomycetota bacterium]
MSRACGYLIGVAIFAFMTYLVGVARVRLDEIVGEDVFHEMVYLPSGDTLKVAVLGFDQPAADALFIKTLIYFSGGWSLGEERWAKRGMTHELLESITYLSPRFIQAYQMGSMFLASSPDLDAAVNGTRLLQKGIDYYSSPEGAADPTQDPRWLFHSLRANIFDVNIQIYHRARGDLAAASGARLKALEEYRLAAASPGVPLAMVQVAAGYEQMMLGNAGGEKSLEAAIAVWEDAYKNALSRQDAETMERVGEKLKELTGQLEAIDVTKYLQEELTAAGRRYMEQTGHPPESPADLLEARLIPGIPITPLSTEEAQDKWLVLPDGSIKSQALADLDTKAHLDFLIDKIVEFVKAYPDRKLRGFDDLIAVDLLDAPPIPPLAMLGQTYDFDSRMGWFVSRMPFGPEPSPPPTTEEAPQS